MIRALWTATTGMHSQQTRIDVIANNLANVNTSGFKKSQVNFQDLLYQNQRAAGTDSSQAGTQVPTGVQLGHGVKVASVNKMFTQGSYQHTGNELDLAVEGKGFFQVQLPNGQIAYTRDGSFKLDSTGQVVTSDGYPLQPGFTIPSDAVQVTIGQDGSFSVMQSDNVTPTLLGQIQLAQFVNPAGLTAMGNNLFKESGASGNAVVGNPNEEGMGSVLQQFLEQSNVSMVEEMVNMIATQRAYELNSKTVQTADDMLSQAANMKR